MKPKILLYAVCCLTIITTSSAEVAESKESQNNLEAAQLPIEYFTKNSKTREVILSPDGKHIVALLNHQGKEVFNIINLENKKPISLIATRGAGENIGNVHWVSNDRIIYSIFETSGGDKRKSATGELYGVNLDGSLHKIIFGYRAGEQTTGTRIKKRKASYGSHRIIDLLKDDEKHVLIVYYPWKLRGNFWVYNDSAIPIIQKLNVYTGKLKKIDVLPITGSSPVVDNKGVVRFAVGTSKDNRTAISYKKTKESDWQEFSLDNFEGTSIYPIGFTEENQNVYLAANIGKGTRAIFLFNLADQSLEKIFHDAKVDVDNIYLDFAEKRAIYVDTALELPKYHYLDPNDQKSKLHKKLMKAFPGQDVVITSASKDASKMIVFTYADNSPGDYYLFDTKTLNADYVMSKSSWVDPELMANTESVSFTTRDHQTIYGYLTLPKVNNADGLPLVVYPHGGPHARDYWGYDWHVQLLANQGYAVLQVNFRGSSGFGKAFQDIGDGKWGTLMQDDITDATRALIARKIVDPHRICIYGTSYGGYAALMGSVREPDLYQCAIGSAGVYDLPLMFDEGNIANRLKHGQAFLTETLGSDIEDLKARSPVYNVDKIKARILLIHGGKDEQVPIAQAIVLKEAFDKINKPYQWLELSNEGHGYNDDENRKLIYQKILDFLDENIGPKSTQSVVGQ